MTSENSKTTVLRLELDARDADRFVQAFKAGKLDDFGVVSMEFPSRPDLNIKGPEEERAARHREEKKGLKQRDR
jgi:hypothetical protein